MIEVSYRHLHLRMLVHLAYSIHRRNNTDDNTYNPNLRKVLLYCCVTSDYKVIHAFVCSPSLYAERGLGGEVLDAPLIAEAVRVLYWVQIVI